MTVDQAVGELHSHTNAANLAGMARYGIRTDRALGRRAGRSHALARELWASGIHEARILATLVEELERVTPRQMDRWARAKPEFVRRAGFSLMAGLAVKAADACR